MRQHLSAVSVGHGNDKDIVRELVTLPHCKLLAWVVDWAETPKLMDSE